MNTKFYLLIITIIILFAGCTQKQPKILQPTVSQVELRAMQSKEIEGVDFKKATKMVLQLLQDDNFEIKNADADLGYLKANKKLDGGKEKYEFSIWDIYYPIAIYKYATLGTYTKEIISTISVRQLNNKIVIRSSFIIEILDDDNKLVSRSTIEDKKFYQSFYSKLDKALFLEKNNL